MARSRLVATKATQRQPAVSLSVDVFQVLQTKATTVYSLGAIRSPGPNYLCRLGPKNLDALPNSLMRATDDQCLVDGVIFVDGVILKVHNAEHPHGRTWTMTKALASRRFGKHRRNAIGRRRREQ